MDTGRHVGPVTSRDDAYWDREKMMSLGAETIAVQGGEWRHTPPNERGGHSLYADAKRPRHDPRPLDAPPSRAHPGEMYVVAIRRFDGDEEDRAARLAAAAGLALFEARGRGRPPGPRVVATFGDRGDAEMAAAALDAAGFTPLLVGSDDFETDRVRFIARTVRLEGDLLVLTTRQGLTARVVLPSVELLLRGTALRTERITTVTKERKLSLGKAVLTGGVLLTKSVDRKVTRDDHDQEPFLHLYAAGQPPLVLREAAIVWQPWNAGRPLEPTRAGNFAQLIAELRARAPAATWDDRLLARPGQSHVLGGALDPEAFLDVAVTLLAKALRPASAETAP